MQVRVYQLYSQGLPLRGTCISNNDNTCSNNDQNKGDIHSNLIQLLQLRRKDMSSLDTLLQKFRDKFVCPKIQNEILQIVALDVIRKITVSIAGKKFTIMVDETNDISNTEELAFCLHYVITIAAIKLASVSMFNSSIRIMDMIPTLLRACSQSCNTRYG